MLYKLYLYRFDMITMCEFSNVDTDIYLSGNRIGIVYNTNVHIFNSFCLCTSITEWVLVLK